ncbi:DoxX family protein [Streptomyces sp. NBC_00876]|uniref:DoxX family protein n=1 Tax=Streptomyces sp. NBC_00876 TaxID=2975853 RepID=UPI00386BDF70|nr:DoxX family protein [Streptomyces sp. NBC_00876]
MFIAYAVVGILLALVLSASAFLTFTANDKITGNMAKVGVPDSWLPRLAALKALGAVGLLIGLGVPLIGAAAAAGVVLYFIGAVVAHVRAKDHEMAPAVVLALIAVAALVLRLLSA